MKVAVCTLCINDWYKEIVKYAVITTENYAKKHGYDFYICNEVYDGTRDYPWYKIKAIQKILPKYDFVFWIDADGFILKPELSITYFIDGYLEDKDILCTKDHNNTLNTGVMIIRNTPFVHSLMYEVWNNKEKYDESFHEQASMGVIYDNNRLRSKDKIKILPYENQSILYNYWPNFYPGKQFFIHIARCTHDPTGFMLTLDNYCPIRMEEDKHGEYEDRMSWLSDVERCRKDTDNWVKNTGSPRMSTRNVIYREKFARENLEEKINKTRFKRQTV
jgi:hypothetical protein